VTVIPSMEDLIQAAPTALLSELLNRAIAHEAIAGPGARALVEGLRDLKGRLVGERLQLAVLGQFKRGKSTLLNALLGAEVLPMGVLPVTSIPTFLETATAPALSLVYMDGHQEEVAGINRPEQLRGHLAGLVTEEVNPNNSKELAQVTVRLASPLLQKGVVLIDTPGVGSTFQHNTQAAEAALPACDAALFVVSPDPPITEVEINYLARVRTTAGRIILVLNKIDLLGPADADSMEAFLRRTLADRAGMAEPLIFRVSARAALRARLSGDKLLLTQSGLPELEAYLGDFLAREKRGVLGAAVARKARALVTELRFQIALRLQALRMPLADLEQRRRVFEEAIGGFETHRRVVGDLLAANRTRTLGAIDEEAAHLRAKLGAALEEEIAQRAVAGQEAKDAWTSVQEDLPNQFQAELEGAIGKMRTGLDTTFAAHQRRVDQLVDLVQRTAAELFIVPFRPAPRVTGFEARFLPYWVVTRPDALNPLPPGALDRLLPRKLRERRARRRTSGAIADVTSRNVENLRWAMRQNVEEAFRRFAADVDARFAASLAATRDVLNVAASLRAQYATETDAEIDRLQAASGDLEAIEGELAAALDASSG
jgi:GTPase SAR1 family protein